MSKPVKLNIIINLFTEKGYNLNCTCIENLVNKCQM